MRPPGALAACALTWAAFGCTPHARTTLTSKTYPVASAGDVERLIVLANVESQGFSNTMAHGLETGLKLVLERCRVESRVILVEPSREAESERVTPAYRQLGPNAWLLIEPAQGDVDIDPTLEADLDDPIQRSGGGLDRVNVVVDRTTGEKRMDSSTVYFQLELFDAATRKLRWLARAQVELTAGRDLQSGSELAAAIVTRLRDDGMVGSCPPGPIEAPWSR